MKAGFTSRFLPGELVQSRLTGVRAHVVIEAPDRAGRPCVLVRDEQEGILLGWLVENITRVAPEATP